MKKDDPAKFTILKLLQNQKFKGMRQVPIYDKKQNYI